MPFIPTTQVMQALIYKAAMLNNEQDVLMQINPKERKRVISEYDLDEQIFEPYCELRVLPTKIPYPDLEGNWPEFFEETSLQHLTEKYKPTKLR